MSLTSKFLKGEIDPDEYVSKTFDLIKKKDSGIKAFITLRKEEEVLQEVKERRNQGGKLAGVLLAVKDNISTAGIRTTCASKMLEDYVPPYNATVINKVLKEGAVIIGKTNMDEFAMGSTTETSYFGPTRNPWDLERTPGGSSGGSAASIAAGYVSLALGSDTGGSIRAPASFNGAYGLKPSYGTVSRFGLVAYANSLEQIGPIAGNSEYLSMLFSIIAGEDPRDATTISYSAEDKPTVIPLKGLRVGVISNIMESSDKEIVSIFRNITNKMSDEGAVVEETELKNVELALPSYYVIAMSEASSNLARFDGVRYGFSKYNEGNWKETFSKNRGEGFGLEVKRRILLGSFILSAGYYDQYYIRALKARNLIKKNMDSLFSKYDVLISPTMPVLPPKIGEVIDDPVKMYAIDLNTVLANLTAIPAISLPVGFASRLPVGMQIMGRYLSDTFLLGISRFIEQLTGLHDLIA
ncbi:Asp-tRNA(Asn)/Glu-tRNA(Gln) amidotransferase subunit GatA [Sulfuracidifex tepidarius]|uniref:Asp-tRNA(Asn)/Glu-tRNA(Gln) amidotransferase subunit GatA n=1 Tax=Sulfuracidifex tepidarius TaxID=1294262 RepID=UPI0006D2338C|nr:Asp-tRNA(Asn)/Glu-tRNA(Gln) amidotransferase subunit GatA [Sulfuracidifex tepidarius]